MVRTGCKLLSLLVLLWALGAGAQAQTATYRLHKEASTTAGLFQLKTAAPDGTSLAVTSSNLKGVAAGEYVIKEFDTQAGVPGASGVIPAGSTITFTLWMRKSTSGGTIFPRAKLRLNGASGTLFGTATGATALTSTLTKYTFSVTTSANVTMTAADRFYVWAGVSLTAAPTTNTTAELDIEGTAGGNYDSLVVVPLPQRPTVNSLSPAAGPVGTAVTVSGSNFGASQGTSSLTFNGVAASPSSWGDTAVTAPVPAGATTGPVVVTVNGSASNGVTFNVGETGSISGTVTRSTDGAAVAGAEVQALQAGVVKGSATAAAGGAYTIAGLLTGSYDVQASASGHESQTQGGQQVNAPGATAVNFSLNPTSVTYVYDETGRLIGAIDPNGEVATYAYDAVGNLTSITRRPASQISIIEFTPNGGPVGTRVTISGTGFSATPSQNTVKFNGVVAQVLTATKTQIEAAVPVGATTGPVSVTSPAGTATSASPFTVGNSSAPTITGFSPAVGATGTAVTVSGTNFHATASNNKIAFNGVRGVTSAATATSLTTSVPVGAKSGRISVTTPDGRAVSSADFFIPPPPYTGAEVESTGRIAFGESKVVQISAAEKVAMLVFDAPAGQRMSLSIGAVGLPGSTSVSVYRTDNSQLVSTSVSQNGTGFIDTQTLAEAGTYTIIVDPATGSTGSLTLTLNNATDALGTITAGGPAVTATTTAPGQSARLTFSGSFGQRVSVNFTANSIPGSTSLSILKPDGTSLFSTNVSQNGTRYIDTQTLPTPGTYAVLIDPSAANTGSITVQLNDASDVPSTPITAGGPPVTVTTTVAGQNARVTFAGTEGQRVSLNISAVTVAGTNVTIQNPDGTQLALVSSGTGGAFIDTQTLPTSGTYTIFVDPSSTNTGSATLTLYDVPPDFAQAISPGGPSVAATTTVPGQNARLTFSGSFGQRVSVNFSANSIPGTTSLSILKPDGTSLFSTNVSQNGTRFIDAQTLPMPGVYTVLVDPSTTNVGGLTVQLNEASEQDAGTITPGGPPVTVTTTQAGQSVRLTFTGTAGQRVSLSVPAMTFSGGNFFLYGPNGTTVVNSTSVSAGSFIEPQTLPSDGTYTIVLDPSSTFVGSTTLQLFDVPSDDAGTITPGGPPVTVTTTAPGQNRRLAFTGSFGQRVSVNFSANSIPGTTSVYVLRPDGTSVVSSNVSQNGTRFFDAQTLSMHGTHYVVVDPQNVNTGSITVQLNDAADAPSGTITPGGSPVTVTTTTAGQNARVTFSGTQGQRVSLNISGVTGTGVNVTLQHPDGSAIATVFADASGAFIDAQTLPVNGTYTVFVDPSSTSTGSATLQLYDVPPDFTETLTPGGPASNSVTSVPGQNVRLTFSGTFGQRVSVNFSTNSIPGTTSLSILKPDGTSMTSTNISQNGTRLIDTQVLPMPGVYTILADPQRANVGGVTVQLNDASEISGGALTPGGSPVTVTMSVPGQSARLTFAGTAGQRVSLRLTGVTLASVAVNIFNPDGSALSPVVFAGTSGGFVDTQTLPVTGTYTVVLDPSSGNTGSATLQLSEVPADVSGTVTVAGGPTNVAVTAAGQNARLTFAGNSGQRVTVRVTNNTMSTTTVALLNPDGTQLTSSSSSSATITLTTQTLPVAGTYAVRIDPSGTNTGGMDVSVTDDGVGTPGVLDVSTSITVGGAPVTVTTTTSGQAARLTFTGSFGQRVSVNLSGNTIPSTTTVSLLRPDGSSLGSTTLSQNNTGFLDAQTLPANGTYTVLVDPPGTNVGSMTVKLNDAADVPATPITPGGAAVTVATSVPGQNARATFSGTQGQRVSLRITGVTVAGTNVAIQNPDGTQLALIFSGTGGAFIDAQTLPASGTYTIFVDPSSTNTGSATLTLYDVPSDNAGTITPGGPPVAVTAGTPGQNQRLTFDATPGQKVSISATANSIAGSTRVYLLRPDGSAITSVFVGQGSAAYLDTQTLPFAGTYAVLVDPSTTNTGGMTVQLHDSSDVDAGTITPGGPPVTVTTTQAGQNARLTFNATAGQRVSLSMSGVTISSVTPYIYNPDGTTFLTGPGFGTSGGFVDTRTLPATGTYTLIVDPSSSSTGSATLTLFDVPSDDAGTITPGGPAVAVAATVPGQNQRLTFAGSFGQKVSVNLSGNSVTGSTNIAIVKPDGANLTSQNVSQSTSYIDAQTLPYPGVYTIVVNPSSMNLGGMTVQLVNSDDTASDTLTPGGPPVTVTTTQAGQNARLTFAGTAGQRVSLHLTGATYSGGGNLSVYNPNGSTLASTSFSTSGFLDAQTLPANGTYTILLDPSGSAVGSATLQLYDVPSDDAGTITPGGPPVTVTTSVPGQNRRLTFTGSFGQRVSLNLGDNTAPGSTSVLLVRPDGTNVTSANIGQTGTVYIDTQSLPLPGTYTVFVNPSSSNTGSLSVKLNDASEQEGTITPNGTPAAVSIAQPGQSARLTFAGTAGQTVSVQFTGNTLGTVLATVVNPDGSVLALSNTGGAGFNLANLTLPTSGTFFIRVDPSGETTGGVTVTLTSP